MLTKKMIEFKEKLQNKINIGIFSKTTDSSFIEAAGLSGLDFIILDCEHGIASLETLQNHVRAAMLTDMAPVIRVKGNDAQSIGAALDIGAFGIQVPNVSLPDQVRDVVRAAKFYPDGMRGACRYVRAANYGCNIKSEYFKNANKASIIIQVEGLEGIKNLDGIISVGGFDVLFIGPYDLAQSVGLPGQVNAPEVLNLIQEISSKALARGIKLGIFSDSIEKIGCYANSGFSYIAYSVDISIFREACANIVTNK